VRERGSSGGGRRRKEGTPRPAGKSEEWSGGEGRVRRGRGRERVAAGEMLDLELWGEGGRHSHKGGEETRVRGDGADAQHVIYHGNTI
jgi:hypothetical protein